MAHIPCCILSIHIFFVFHVVVTGYCIVVLYVQLTVNGDHLRHTQWYKDLTAPITSSRGQHEYPLNIKTSQKISVLRAIHTKISHNNSINVSVHTDEG